MVKKRLADASLSIVAGIGSAFANDPAPDDRRHQPYWREAAGWPDRIVVTLPDKLQTSFAVTWRTAASIVEPHAEIVEARDDARFDLGAERVAAKTEALDLATRDGFEGTAPLEFNEGVPPAHFHSVTFDGLKPDTVYAHRVRGAEGLWSEWLQTRTAAQEGPVSFLYFGDAQNALRSHWSRVVRAGFQAAPKADFILHAGDLVNRASRDLEWAEWFEATGFIHGMIPAAPPAGNHEYEYLPMPETAQERLLSTIWRPQFTLPNEPTLHPDLQEVVYDLRYSDDIHLFALSTQSLRIEWPELSRWSGSSFRF